MRVDKEFVLREIAGDYIIIPTGKTVLEFNGLITVNEVGVSIWNMLQKEVTFDKLVQGILDEYDVISHLQYRPSLRCIAITVPGMSGFHTV